MEGLSYPDAHLGLGALQLLVGRIQATAFLP